MIVLICIYLNYLINKKIIIKIFEIFTIVFAISMCFIELKIYNHIGNVHKDRLKQIEIVKSQNLKVLEYKIIDEKYAKYHPDANSPSSTEYWAYNYFRFYYGLDEDVVIKLID